MGRNKPYLFLHTSEWSRLKDQGAQTNKPPEKNFYIESLIEQSQKWIKSWPDTVQGHIMLMEKQKEKQHAKVIEEVDLYEMHKKHIRKAKAIEKARKNIFDDTCYGRRLISAFIESKTLEERDIQVEFQKKLKLDSEALEQSRNGSIENYNNTESTDKALQQQRRERDKEVALINKAIYTTQTEEKKQENERQRKLELEDLRTVKELIEKENVAKRKCKFQMKHDMEHFEAERRIIKVRNLGMKKKDELITDVWKNYEERKNAGMKKMAQKSLENPHFTKNYELIKKLKNEEAHRYDEFVNNAIKIHKSRILKQEQEQIIKAVKEREIRTTLMQVNKKLAEVKRLTEKNLNKRVCERQSIIAKCADKRITREMTKQSAKSPSFLTKTSIGAMKQIDDPALWNGLNAAHAQFAQQANKTLKECRYKNFARKVVDDYRRLNCLDSQTLPISNY